MNRLEKLQHDLQLTTKAKVVNNVHLANITGFSRPSISEAKSSGNINQRMSRVLDLVDLVIKAYDITALWDLAEHGEFKTAVTIAEYVTPKLDRMLSVRRVLEENQLDIVDEYGRPDVPAWVPLQWQSSVAALSDEQLRHVVAIGEISEQGALGALKEFIKNSSDIDDK